MAEAVEIQPTRLYLMMEKIRECLCDALGGNLCFCGVILGDQSVPLGILSGCTNDGVAWVRPAASYGSTSFPLQNEPGSRVNAGSPLALEIEIGVGRPYPRPEGKAMYPDPVATSRSALRVMEDMRVMKNALQCCFPKDSPFKDALIELGVWTPLPAQAGAAGGTWSAWIG